MLLELGSGYRPYQDDGRDWVHTDIQDGPHIEMVFPAEHLYEEVGSDACDEIRATHLLEHFPFGETVNILYNWYLALKPGGSLYIEVPHIFGHIAAWERSEITSSELITYIYGEQDFPYNFHYAGFTANMLRDKLIEAGFIDIDVTDIGMVLIAKAYK